MFRTLGLRHLMVVNKKNQVLGIVTRCDLVATHYMGGDSNEASQAELRRQKKHRQQQRRNSINHSIDINLDDDPGSPEV